jgi:DNA-binding MarR family transcriptional regulator
MSGERSDGVDVTDQVNQVLASLHRRDLATLRHKSQLARSLGLSDVDVTALILLAREQELTTAQLGQMLGLSSGGATALVQRLERQGLVRRRAHPHDRRSTLLRLNGSAAAMMARFDDRVAEGVEREMRRLSAQQRARAIELLNRIADLHGTLVDQPGRARKPPQSATLIRPVPSSWS